MTRILLSLLLVLGVACGAAAQTAGPTSPYSATVPVAGTSDAQRTAAMISALAAVLEQVSPGFNASSESLSEAPGYVRDYHYRRAAGGGLELQVAFDPGAVGRMLAAAGGSAVAQPGAAASTGVPVAAGGTGTLWVAGIENSHAFASALSLLRNDPSLHNVTPVATEADGVLLRLTFDQPLMTVLAGLAGPAGHLAQDTQPHQGADASVRWIP